MPAQLGKSLVARRSDWNYTRKEEQKGDLALLYILDFLGGYGESDDELVDGARDKSRNRNDDIA